MKKKVFATAVCRDEWMSSRAILNYALAANALCLAGGALAAGCSFGGPTQNTPHLDAVFRRLVDDMGVMEGSQNKKLPAYAAYNIFGHVELPILVLVNTTICANFMWIAFVSYRIYRIAKIWEKNGARRTTKNNMQKAIGRIILCHTIVPLAHGGKSFWNVKLDVKKIVIFSHAFIQRFDVDFWH